MTKAMDMFFSTLCPLWYSTNVFNLDEKQTSGFMNKFLGAASVCTLFLGFFLGYLADRSNYRRLVSPIFFLSFVLLMVVYVGECMTCVWMTVLLGMSSTLTFSNNSTVTWLLAKNVRSEAKGTVFGLYNLSGGLGLLSFGIAGPHLVEGVKDIFLIASLLGFLGSMVSLSVWMKRD